MADAWAAHGVDLPDGFVFPITILGQVADLHGEGVFVNTTPTRVDCYVHVETTPAPSQDPPRLELFPSPLHPERRTELGVAYEFEHQLSLALWLYRSAPCHITAWPSRRMTPVSWSLRGSSLQRFLRFSSALIDFQDDRQAYLVARVSPDVLEDDELRVFFVGGHRIDGRWLKARWPVMAATDLYERARRSREVDIAFLLLMMALEVLFNDGSSELSRRIAQRCALLNGRTSAHRKQLFDMLLHLYGRRSRLVHGDLLEKGRVLTIPKEDLLQATDLVRLSLLRFIALSRVKTKAEVMRSLEARCSIPASPNSSRWKLKSTGGSLEPTSMLRSTWMLAPKVLAEETAEQAVSPDAGPRSLRSLGPPQVNGSVGQTIGDVDRFLELLDIC